MLWSELAELEDCEQCPLYIEKICPGGTTSGPNGPIEPPCCSFNDDTDLDQWVSEYYDNQRRHEAWLDEKYKKEQEKKRKNDIKRRRQHYLKMYCYSETYDIKRLEKRIRALESSIRLAEDLAFAFNTTNEMFGYSERTQVDPKKNKALEKLKEELKIAQDKVKAKREEGRKTEAYKAIC